MMIIVSPSMVNAKGCNESNLIICNVKTLSEAPRLGRISVHLIKVRLA
jgi:hypothetical protein